MVKKILIIDDDRDYVEAISTLLQVKGYQVAAAHEGKTGFEKAKKDQPDLIILDVMMTNKTEGFDVARHIKEDDATKGIPVILVSGMRKELSLPFKLQTDEEFLPVKAILEKPVKPEELLNAVAQFIR